MCRSATGSVEFRDENYILTSVIYNGDLIIRVFCIPELNGFNSEQDTNWSPCGHTNG